MPEDDLPAFDAPADDLAQGRDAAPARAELTPQEALELVRQGKPVEHARVRRLKLRGAFDGPVLFKNCTLVQPEFDNATFADEVAFVGCSVEKLACRKASTFAKGLDVSHSVLSRSALTRLTVNGRFAATSTEFRNKAVIADCTFAGRVSFWEAKFCGWADVKGCRFKGEADFRAIHADQGFVMTACHFERDFLFRGSAVAKKFQADGCWFDGLLDLSKAKLMDFAYLEGIGQGPGQRFAVLNAVADRLLVRPDQVQGRLASEQAGRFEEAMQEYGLLKRCYQSLHRFDHEDWAFYRFKVNQRRAKSATWRRPWTVWRRFADWLFFDVGCGYGTHPGRAVRMALVIVLAFAVLYGTNVEMFYIEKLPFPKEDGYEKTHPANQVMIGLTTSVSVFTSGMGGIREIAKGWMNVPVMVESLMGTLLFGLFIVAFSRKVIR